MAQLRYTKYAAVCGTAALTVGLFGVYLYKRRSARKVEDTQSKIVNSGCLKSRPTDVEEAVSEHVTQVVSDSVVQNECISGVDVENDGETEEIVSIVEETVPSVEETVLPVAKIALSAEKLPDEDQSEKDHTSNVELPSSTDEVQEMIPPLEEDDIEELKSSFLVDEIVVNEIVEEPITESTSTQQECALPPSSDPPCDMEENGISDDAAGVNNLTLDWATCTTVEENGCANKEESLVSPTVSLQSHPEGSVTGSDLSTETNSDSSSFDSGRCTGSTTSCTGAQQQLSQPSVQDMPTVYQFEFPAKECGRLIGKAGKNIKGIRNRSGARITLEDCPGDESKQICIVEGLQSEIDAALLDIQKKFPAVDTSKPYVDRAAVPAVVAPEMSQVYLHDEIVNDVLVSSVVSAGHVFIQQPTHPTYMALNRLNSFMNNCYSQMNLTPPLPRPIEVGVICAAPIMQGWYRAQIVDIYPDADEVDLKFLDYGGYARTESCFLKQIRTDFMSLPFQASECYMANVAPLAGEDDFSETARVFVEQVAQSFAILQAQVTGYSDDGIPFIELFYTDSERRVQSLNKELVNQGLVTWYEEGIDSSGDADTVPTTTQ